VTPRLPHAALGALAISTALAGAIGGALAQDTGLDLAAIRARAGDHSEEADALAHAARERATAVTAEATQAAEGGKSNGRRYAGQTRPDNAPTESTFDFDRMVSDAGDMTKAKFGEAPRFIAFASTSMPKEALQQMMRDVTHAGGVVVFRGLAQGSGKAMTAALTQVFAPGERLDGVGIDPRLFRAFGIEAVPTYVVAASDFDLCSGFDCSSAVPPFDRLTGNVTTSYALETMAAGGGPGAKIAAQHLARLEDLKP
jgi:conjugal transfer pilus assembly protein TrbC